MVETCVKDVMVQGAHLCGEGAPASFPTTTGSGPAVLKSLFLIPLLEMVPRTPRLSPRRLGIGDGNDFFAFKDRVLREGGFDDEPLP
jgi:hypothetical protein